MGDIVKQQTAERIASLRLTAHSKMEKWENEIYNQKGYQT